MDGSVLFASNEKVDVVATLSLAETVNNPPASTSLASVVRCGQRAASAFGGRDAEDRTNNGECIIHRVLVYNGWLDREEMRMMYNFNKLW